MLLPRTRVSQRCACDIGVNDLGPHLRACRSTPVGRDALLVEVDDAAAALELATWARSAGAAAVEVVPAATTVLFDGVEDRSALAGLIGSWAPTGARPEGELVEIPVTYDGADLAFVADAWGTDEAGWSPGTAEIEFVAAFCGFAPGFSYLAGLPEGLAVPRLESPRPSVPAGSVGLAGTWCGVYPTASPGGWRLLGRTDAALLGPDPGPAGAAGTGHPGEVRARMSLHVVNAGALTTVQDRGRFGLAHLGVPRAGALDAPAAALANRLVGNGPDAAVLEALLGGLVLRADAGCWVAITGAGRAHPAAEWLPAGATLRIETPTTGLRSYVAVAGGIDVPPVLGSRSTDTLAWVGPPRVEAGATLPVGERTRPAATDRRARDRRAAALADHAGSARRLVRRRRAGPAVRHGVRRGGRLQPGRPAPRRAGAAAASRAIGRAGQRGDGARRRAGAAERRRRWCSWPTTRRPAATR